MKLNKLIQGLLETAIANVAKLEDILEVPHDKSALAKRRSKALLNKSS